MSMNTIDRPTGAEIASVPQQQLNASAAPAEAQIKEEIRYFCNPLFDGRVIVVAVGTLADVYALNSRLPRWTLCYTKEYLNTIPDDQIVWFQQEFDFD